MADNNTLAKALADVRHRRAELQVEYERITVELGKLRIAEASLSAIVEGEPLGDATALLGDLADGSAAGGLFHPVRTGRRVARGPRANSAKGRLRKLLNGTGLQGLTQAEIVSRLPDVSPTTIGAYLSGMVSRGEAVRSGDFFKMQAAAVDAEGSDQTEAHEQDELAG